MSYWYTIIITILIFLLIVFYCIHKKIIIKIFNKIKEKSKILVVDDINFPYFKKLQEDLYNITYIKDINLKQLNDIINGEYDIIMLDIKGVGKKMDCKNDGFDILKHIKEQNRSVLIIVFSNEAWMLNRHREFSMADKVLSKTSDLIEFKSAIDELLWKKHLKIFKILYFLIKKGVGYASGSVN